MTDEAKVDVLDKGITFTAYTATLMMRAKSMGFNLDSITDDQLADVVLVSAQSFKHDFNMSNSKRKAVTSIKTKILESDYGMDQFQSLLRNLKCEEAFIKEVMPLFSGSMDDVDLHIRNTFPEFEEISTEPGMGPLATHETIPSVAFIPDQEYKFDLDEMVPILSQFVVDRDRELMGFLRLGLFQGFDRIAIMQRSFETLSFQAIFVIAVLTALRGPVKVMNDEAIVSIPVAKSDGSLATIGQLFTTKILHPERRRAGKLKRNDLTAGRISNAFADLSVYGLLRLYQLGLITKRIETNPLPPWMQCTQAASLPLSGAWRENHAKFSEEFSSLIGGTFSASIYSQQSSNIHLPDGPVREELISASGGSILEDYTKNATFVPGPTAESKPKAGTNPEDVK